MNFINCCWGCFCLSFVRMSLFSILCLIFSCILFIFYSSSVVIHETQKMLLIDTKILRILCIFIYNIVSIYQEIGMYICAYSYMYLDTAYIHIYYYTMTLVSMCVFIGMYICGFIYTYTFFLKKN